MATRGARPKPTALKVLQGTDRADRRNEHEPHLKAAVPECPAHLSDEAKLEWERTSKLLSDVGLLAAIDRAALASYCHAWGRWVGRSDQAARRCHQIPEQLPHALALPGDRQQSDGPDASAPDRVRHDAQREDQGRGDARHRDLERGRPQSRAVDAGERPRRAEGGAMNPWRDAGRGRSIFWGSRASSGTALARFTRVRHARFS